MENLTGKELCALIERVFDIKGNLDKSMGFLIDLPDEKIDDNELWKDRREMVFEWYNNLKPLENELGLEIFLYYYQNVHINNGDLREDAYLYEGGEACQFFDSNFKLKKLKFSEIFSNHSIFIAPTEFSATAPLKLAAKQFPMRGATMPGFSREMIPSLKLDYVEINRRVLKLKNVMDPAIGGKFVFELNSGEIHEFYMDLRFRTAHASGGVLVENGVAGNLPSGEAYMVPNEGENVKSKTEGILPVQFENEIVLYEIKQNKAVNIISSGKFSDIEREKLKVEPAYGNIAELGLGVLEDFGVKPCGEILLDEKLGLHIAFGRSDHFGGQVGTKDFTKPENVIHIDRVYIPQTQPKINVKSGDLIMENGEIIHLFKNSKYVFQF
jgi:hypothetical protein